MKKKKGIELIVKGFDDMTAYDQDELRDQFDEFFASVKSGVGNIDLINEQKYPDFMKEIHGALFEENQESQHPSKFVASEHLDRDSDAEDENMCDEDDEDPEESESYQDEDEELEDEIDDENDTDYSIIQIDPFNFSSLTMMLEISSFYKNLSSIDFSTYGSLRKDPDDFEKEDAEALFNAFQKAFITMIPPTVVLSAKEFTDLLINDFGKITKNTRIRMIEIDTRRFFGINIYDGESFDKNITEFWKFISENHIIISSLNTIFSMMVDEYFDGISGKSFSFEPTRDIGYYLSTVKDFNDDLAHTMYEYFDNYGKEIHSEESVNLNPVDDYFTALVEERLIVLDSQANDIIMSFKNTIKKLEEKIESGEDDEEESFSGESDASTDVDAETPDEISEDEERTSSEEEPEEDFGSGYEDQTEVEPVEVDNISVEDDDSSDEGQYSTILDALRKSGYTGDGIPEEEDNSLTFTPHRKGV